MRRPFSRFIKGEKGLSLIEMLIAVSILSFIGLVLYTVFYQGTKLWQRSLLMKPDIESGIVFEKMAHDLRSAYSAQMGSFDGKAARVEFYAYSRSALEDSTGETRIDRPAKVQYLYDAGTRRLYRGEETYIKMLAFLKLESAPLELSPLADNLKDCRFEYYHEDINKKIYQWKDFWDSPCPPKAIRVSLRFDDQKETVFHTKIIPLPADACISAAMAAAAHG